MEELRSEITRKPEQEGLGLEALVIKTAEEELRPKEDDEEATTPASAFAAASSPSHGKPAIVPVFLSSSVSGMVINHCFI